MLKDNIKSFVIGLEDLIGNRSIERTDDESETVTAESVLKKLLASGMSADEILSSFTHEPKVIKF